MISTPSQSPRMTPDANTATVRNQPAVDRWGTFEAAGFGTLWLAWWGDTVTQLSFDRFTRGDLGEPTTVPEWLSEPLRRYFAGEPGALATIAVAPSGTKFQKRVWAALRDIPWGHVRTYGGVAADVGSPRGMRAVGAANGANPIPVIIPCHRVVEAGHTLGGYSGGLDRKRFLLRLEGARISEGVVQPGQLSLF